MNLNKYTFPTKHGLLLSTQSFPNGNMLRTTAELLFLCDWKLTEQEDDKYCQGILDCLSPIPGVYSRYPDKLENTTVDDYLVLGCHLSYAKTILNSLKNHFGFLDINYPKISFKQFLFRFQGMVQHLRISCYEQPGLLGQFFWALSIYLATKEPFSNQDSWCLSHLMILTKEKRKYNSWLTDLAVKYWKIKKGNVKTSDLVSQYLGPECQDHPLIEAWKLYD